MVVVALVACAYGEEEVHDQEAAEQFFLRYGYYPTWYTAPAYTTSYYGAIRSFPLGYPFGYAPLVAEKKVEEKKEAEEIKEVEKKVDENEIKLKFVVPHAAVPVVSTYAAYVPSYYHGSYLL